MQSRPKAIPPRQSQVPEKQKISRGKRGKRKKKKSRKTNEEDNFDRESLRAKFKEAVGKSIGIGDIEFLKSVKIHKGRGV